MGLLVDGVWQQDGSRTKDGHFIRPTTQFRNWVTPDGAPALPAKAALPPRAGAITSTSRSPAPGRTAPSSSASSKAWRTSSPCRSSRPTCSRTAGPSTQDEGSSGDAVNGKSKLSEIYLLADAEIFRPRQRAGAVGQDSARRSSTTSCRKSSACSIRRSTPSPTCTPTITREALRAEIDRVNEQIYPNVNNGVYRAGFATSQAAYEQAFRNLFDTLDEMEQRLAQQRYLVGNKITEADWRFFVHADPLRRRLLFALQVQLAAHLRISQPGNYVRDLYQQPGVAETVTPGADQAALLRQPAAGEPDRHRAGGPAARFLRAA